MRERAHVPTSMVFQQPDPGIDDAMAIIFAEAHPALDVIGITTGTYESESECHRPVLFG